MDADSYAARHGQTGMPLPGNGREFVEHLPRRGERCGRTAKGRGADAEAGHEPIAGDVVYPPTMRVTCANQHPEEFLEQWHDLFGG